MKKLQKETNQPNQVKAKKPFYKKWYTWAAAIIVIGVATTGNDETTETVAETKPAITQPAEQAAAPKEAAPAAAAPKEEAPKVEDKTPKEHKNALKKAEMYAKTMAMSKKGIYDQLTSEYGENFPVEAADYAMSNLEYDWKANALEKAKTYQETMSMSTEAIRDQLVSEYGERFTQEEANWAIDNLE